MNRPRFNLSVRAEIGMDILAMAGSGDSKDWGSRKELVAERGPD